MSDRTRKLAWAAVIVAAATGLSRVAGLAREVLVAAVYGVDPDMKHPRVEWTVGIDRELTRDVRLSVTDLVALTGARPVPTGEQP